MKNLKIFPKMFLQIFSVLGIIILFIHLLVFFIFPKTYLERRKEDLTTKANEVSRTMEGRDLAYIEEALDLYSKTSEVQAGIKGDKKNNAIPIGQDLDINLDSANNSLIIEEREIGLDTGEKISLQFISTADMQKEAKDLSLEFLPYSLAISLLFSIIIALIYAKTIKNNIEEITRVTDKMMALDKEAQLEVDSTNEVGHLKEQINDLYRTLLEAMESLNLKNQEIIKLEKLKYDFFRGASHELKTPLASLKIILENMKYKIGKYKDRDLYIQESIDLVDSLTENISQILTLSSLDNLKNDGEVLKVKEVLEEVLEKYQVLAKEKNIRITEDLGEETIWMGRTALKIILSNLMSNAVKYTDPDGHIHMGVDGDWFFMKNTYKDKAPLDMGQIFDVNFDLNKKNSNGLGLYIVGNLFQNYHIKYEALQGDGKFIFKFRKKLEN